MANKKQMEQLAHMLPREIPRPRSAGAISVEKSPNRGNVTKLVSDMRADDSFRLGMSVIRTKIMDAAVTVEIESTAPGEEELAEAVAANLRNQWDKSIESATQAIEYGRAAFEGVQQWSNESGGFFRLRELFYMPFEDTTPLFDSFGGLSGVRVGSGENAIVIPSHMVWWVAVNASPKQPNGKSIYADGPDKILAKRKKADEWEDIWMKRFSIGSSTIYGPAEVPTEGKDKPGDIGELDINGQKRDPLGELVQVAEDTKAGGTVILPSTNYRDGGGRMYERVVNDDLKDATPIENRQKYLDVRSLRSLGVPERALIHDSDVGTNALAQTHLGILNSLCNGYLSVLVESFRSGPVAEACRINGMRSTLGVSYRKIGDKSDAQAADILRATLQTPSPSPMAVAVLDWSALLESTGLPLAEDARAQLEKIRNSVVASVGQGLVQPLS